MKQIYCIPIENFFIKINHKVLKRKLKCTKSVQVKNRKMLKCKNTIKYKKVNKVKKL